MTKHILTYRLSCLLVVIFIASPIWAVHYQEGDFIYDCNYSWNQLSATLLRYTGTATEVTIPSSVEYDGNTYPVTSIGDEFSSPFLGNLTIESVRLPDCAISIGVEAFSYCVSLRSVELGRKMQQIGAYAFFQCTKLEHIQMYNQLNTIDEYALSECSSLKTLTLGRRVSHLGDHVFDKTPIETLTILNRVPAQCSGILTTDISLFSSCLLNVPIGYLVSYHTTIPWSQFRQMQEKPEMGDVNADGSIDIQDINLTINVMLGRTSENLDLFDMDGNGIIDISDLNILINTMLGRYGI